MGSPASIQKNILFLMISGLLSLPVLLGACLPRITEPTSTAAVEPTLTSIPATATVTAQPTRTPLPTLTPLPSPTPTATLTLTPSPSPTPASHVLVGAGDIAICGQEGDEQTARLLDEIDGTIFTTGDNVYSYGTPQEFQECFDPSWGRHKDRIRPSAGNHDYGTEGAAGYFAYFGEAAGDPDKGYYSYDLGEWHIIVLNNQCSAAGGCGSDSPQMQWLRAELEANPRRCTLAYWHAPLFSSGLHGGYQAVRPFWQVLYEYGADLILTGHDHNYERFAPQDPWGNPDPEKGIRQFVIGTGGGGLRRFGEQIAANSELRSTGTYGVLKLTLYPGGYDWEFVPVEGGPFTDAGSDVCR